MLWFRGWTWLFIITCIVSLCNVHVCDCCVKFTLNAGFIWIKRSASRRASLISCTTGFLHPSLCAHRKWVHKWWAVAPLFITHTKTWFIYNEHSGTSDVTRIWFTFRKYRFTSDVPKAWFVFNKNTVTCPVNASGFLFINTYLVCVDSTKILILR